MMRFRSYSALALAALAMAGCGGGSTSGGGTSTKSARIGVFVTDDLGAYDHVWVTVKSVVLVGPSGSTAVYDDPTGKLVDLAGLHGTTGSIFEFLGLGSAPAGTYTRALVTLDDNLTLFPAGATVALDRTFKGATGGSKVVEVEVEGQGEEIAGDDSLVIDFDLSRWTDDGTTVTAVAAVRGHEGLDDVARHKGEEAKGTISGLTATGFTLTGRGLPITVTIDANTAVFGGATALANGQRVEVRGAFATANQTLAATSVKVEDGTGKRGGDPGERRGAGDGHLRPGHRLRRRPVARKHDGPRRAGHRHPVPGRARGDDHPGRVLRRAHGGRGDRG